MPEPRTPFIHLHVHSHYSLLDGLSKVEGLVKRAKAFEMPALAITDHGNMHGAIDFYKKATSAGIKPIIGIEAYVANRTRFDKQPNIDNKRYHLTLLATNNTGYRNLIKLITAANLEGYYYKPRMDKDLLREHHEGIIALSGCMAGELARHILDGKAEDAKRIAQEYQSIFGEDNYFMEVMHHPGVPRQTELNHAVIDLAKELSIPLVGTQDTHYLLPEDAKAHKTLLAVQGAGDLFSDGEDFSFIDTDTAYEHLSYAPGAAENTFKIAERCNIELDLGKWVFPNIKTALGIEDPDQKLHDWVYQGIPERGLELTDEIKERIEYELKVIRDKGYSPYFLVVGDLLRFARENNILSNIRGSVAGSMVTYLVGITNVDPIKYSIPFERFLNPFRPSAPDIDMDFADNRRDQMIQYTVDTYGADKVAQIGTFGTMMAKGSVRDVARALGYPYAKGDMISNFIPLGAQGSPMTIEKAMDMVPELKQLYESDPETREIIDLAKKMEGCVRHVSVHAAGVVIAPAPLTDFVPIQFDPRGGKMITQYDMHGVEDAGLLKFDFLGITNLSILGDAVDCVQRLHGITVDLQKLPVDDKQTFEMLARGETMGLFQLNGSGMTKWLKELKPTRIEDINAMVALYRPGPMDSIPQYIACKRDRSLITYLDPRMADILDASYGVITYQDDVLMMAIKLAGYNWEEVDKFRKAIGKKIPAEMEAQREKFIKGSISNGMTPKKALEVWKFIEPFAAYGFNKAHAASYGLVAYWTAYMKAHFPAEYMTAVLTAESNDAEKVMEIIQECRRMGIEVLAPDINESNGSFTVLKSTTPGEKDKIRFGLMAIKNVGAHIVEVVVKERQDNGPYVSIEDVLTRIHDKDLNKKSLESFVRSGALDCFGDRNQMFYNVDAMLAYHKRITQESSSKQASLFGALPVASTPAMGLKMEVSPVAIDPRTKLAWEKELLGLYISAHPLDGIKHLLEQFVISCEAAKKKGNNSAVRISGIVTAAKKIYTKTNEAMLFVTVEDLTDTVEIIVFPSILKDTAAAWDVDKIIAVDGKLSMKDNDPKIICNAVKEVNDDLIATLQARFSQTNTPTTTSV